MIKFASTRLTKCGLFLVGCFLSLTLSFAGEKNEAVGKVAQEPQSVLDSWFIDYDTASLWKITNVTDLNYLILPQIFSYRSRAIKQWDLGDGNLIVRNRFSLLGEYFLEGAESYYFGFSGSPALEWWNAEENFSLYFYAGGGVGFVDSTDIEGGQGQDFAFNWFVQTGVRFRLSERLFATGGLLFQHISNRNLAETNPGLNALGPTLGLSWKF